MTTIPYTSDTHRSFLWRSGGGLGGLALAHLMGSTGLCSRQPQPEFNGGIHHRAKVRRVVQLFMNGGASPMDTFDYKPALEKHHGEKIDFGIKAAATSTQMAFIISVASLIAVLQVISTTNGVLWFQV